MFALCHISCSIFFIFLFNSFKFYFFPNLISHTHSLLRSLHKFVRKNNRKTGCMIFGRFLSLYRYSTFKVLLLLTRPRVHTHKHRHTHHFLVKELQNRLLVHFCRLPQIQVTVLFIILIWQNIITLKKIWGRKSKSGICFLTDSLIFYPKLRIFVWIVTYVCTNLNEVFKTLHISITSLVSYVPKKPNLQFYLSTQI